VLITLPLKRPRPSKNEVDLAMKAIMIAAALAATFQAATAMGQVASSRCLEAGRTPGSFEQLP
jgi:hypothetical protein